MNILWWLIILVVIVVVCYFLYKAIKSLIEGE